MTSLIDAESVLVIDVGSISTRAILFDVVDSRYRFIAKGLADTTFGAPYHNIGEGVRLAIDQLQRITGRILVDESHQLIIPSPSEWVGVDRFAATISVGKPVTVAVVGLLDEISVESARRLALTTYSEIVHTFSLNDRNRPDTRLNLLVHSRPDLVIAAGGTSGGASQSVMALFESIGLACYLIPETDRPVVLFAGNPDISNEVENSLHGLAKVVCAPNVRPVLEGESLDSAQIELSKIITKMRLKKIAGLDELKNWAGEDLLPAATGFGRVVRFLSASLRGKKGVLGIDIGASAITIASALDEDLSLAVFPQYGLSAGVEKCTAPDALENILRWTIADITVRDIREFLINKSLRPSSLPATKDEMDIEQGLARHLIHTAIQKAAPGFPQRITNLSDDLLFGFEPILATGSVVTQAPSLAESALLLLDGLQPAGITTLVLDQNQIAPAIGATAGLNQLLAVQVMDSNAFLNLGTVIAPISNVKPGQLVLRLKMISENGKETNVDVKQGSMEMFPIPYGQTVRMLIQPLHRADIGMGAPGRGGGLTVKGGVLGVIVDARGRPFLYPKDRTLRQDLRLKWLRNMGAQSL